MKPTNSLFDSLAVLQLLSSPRGWLPFLQNPELDAEVGFWLNDFNRGCAGYPYSANADDAATVLPSALSQGPAVFCKSSTSICVGVVTGPLLAPSVERSAYGLSALGAGLGVCGNGRNLRLWTDNAPQITSPDSR